MSGASEAQGAGWWRASDGLWYAPELHPDYQPPYQPPPAPAYAPPPSSYEPPAHQHLGAPPPQQVAPAYAPPPQQVAPAYAAPPQQFAPLPGQQYGATYPPAAPGALALPAGVTATSAWGRLGAYFLELLLLVVTLGIGWLIWALTIADRGQTPAKKILGQRVIRADSLQPVGLGLMFWMRGLVAGFVAQFAILFTIGIILFMPFWDKRNQNIWDKISSTYVVDDPHDAWRAQTGFA